MCYRFIVAIDITLNPGNRSVSKQNWQNRESFLLKTNKRRAKPFDFTTSLTNESILIIYLDAIFFLKLDHEVICQSAPFQNHLIEHKSMTVQVEMFFSTYFREFTHN